MKFTINGKEYTAAKYNYNTACSLEEYGVSIADIQKKPQSVARAYLAISGGMDLEDAGNEIEQHIIDGGDMGELYAAFMTEMDKSGFFKKLVETVKEKKEAEDDTEDKKKK